MPIVDLTFFQSPNKCKRLYRSFTMQIIVVIFKNLLFFIEQSVSLAKKFRRNFFFNECKWKFTLKYELLNLEVWIPYFPTVLTVCATEKSIAAFTVTTLWNLNCRHMQTLVSLCLSHWYLIGYISSELVIALKSVLPLKCGLAVNLSKT